MYAVYKESTGVKTEVGRFDTHIEAVGHILAFTYKCLKAGTYAGGESYWSMGVLVTLCAEPVLTLTMAE